MPFRQPTVEFDIPIHYNHHPALTSPFILQCRCGTTGDGHDKRILGGLEAIQCATCDQWSHIACQTSGPILSHDGSFKCHECKPFALPSYHKCVSSATEALILYLFHLRGSQLLGEIFTIGIEHIHRCHLGNLWQKGYSKSVNIIVNPGESLMLFSSLAAQGVELSFG